LGFLERREVWDKLALADDQLVIDQLLIKKHSYIRNLSGVPRGGLRASRAMVGGPLQAVGGQATATKLQTY